MQAIIILILLLTTNNGILKDKFWSITITKYVYAVTIWILTISTFKILGSLHSCSLSFENIMTLVLSAFDTSLSCAETEQHQKLIAEIQGCTQLKLMSNRWLYHLHKSGKKAFDKVFQRLLTYIENSRGRNMEPWGTPLLCFLWLCRNYRRFYTWPPHF